MTAPALNPAQFIPTPAASGATGGSTTAAASGDAVGAFEALMTALFPQTATPVPGVAQPTVTSLPPEAGLVAEDASEDVATDEASESDVETEAETSVDAEAAALAASLAGAQAAPQPVASAPTKPTTTPPAWGQDKPKGVPAQPALLHANAHADLAGKAVAEDAAVDAVEIDAPPHANTPDLPPKAADAARAAVQQAPARQAAPLPTTPAADPAPDAPIPQAAAAPDADTPNAPTATPTAAAGLETAAAAVAAARPETAASVAPTGKMERNTKTDATSEDVGSGDTARADDAPTKSAAPGSADTSLKRASAKSVEVEPVVRESQGEADAPDTVQPAETRAAGQSAAPAAPATHAVRGSPETVASLAAQIVKKLDGQSTRFDVELDPAGLGKVDVRVEIGAHGRMVASLTFENPQAAQDLKSRSGELQKALEQAGFDLSGGLSFDVAGERGRQGQAWQEQNTDHPAFHGRAFRQALDNAGDAESAATQGALRLRRGVSAGLDLRI